MQNSRETDASSAVRAAIDLRRFPWSRPLQTAYATNFASVAPLFAGNAADPAAWRDTIARVARAPHDRAAIAAILNRQLDARGAPAAARRAAATLEDPKAVAIVTGQQAGLFGGPLYTILKAVTAVQLARRVQADCGVPAVPVFWVEAEDHDWAEVRSATILDAEFQVRRVVLGDLEGAGTRPVARLTLDAGVDDAIEELRTRLAPSEFTDVVLADLGRRYGPGVTMTTAFAGWMDDLMGPHGLVVYEADDPAAKPLVRDLFTAELGAPGRTAGLVRDAAKTMAALGHEPQIEPAEASTALFYLGDGRRTPIKRRGADFLIGDVTRAAPDLSAEAAAHPERFSPNVILRPIVQDRLFPTACYVGGPAEIAYQAQLGGVYRAFGIEPPLLYPRVSATLLDSAAIRFLERCRLPLEALHERMDSALNRLLEAELPPTIDRALDETEKELVARVQPLKDAVSGIDPTLAGAVDTTLDRIRETLKTLHGKVIQAAKRKDDTLRRQFQRTHALVYPDDTPQERALSGVFFLNRYGPALADRLLEALPLDTDKHYVVTL